jgi:ATP-dependent Lon protease
VLTGQLGDVMKESGQAALTFARWRLAHLGIDEGPLARRQVHVHVPAGGIPKDGPSAGVTIAAALISLATGIPVRHDVAMTGEVTLRGRVLPVGGVREKSLAALRAGIRTVVLPRQNVPDLREVPAELARRIRFIPVDHMDEVLEEVLQRSLAGRRPRVPRPRAAAGRPPIAHAKAEE